MESRAHRLGVLVVFHWRLLTEYRERRFLYHLLHRSHPSPLLWLHDLFNHCYFPPFLVLPSVHRHHVLQHPLSFPLFHRPPSLSPSQFLNSTARNNHRQANTPHSQVMVSTNPPHHYTSCHWYHDNCLGSLCQDNTPLHVLEEQPLKPMKTDGAYREHIIKIILFLSTVSKIFRMCNYV